MYLFSHIKILYAILQETHLSDSQTCENALQEGLFVILIVLLQFLESIEVKNATFVNKKYQWSCDETV